ncbi:MAG: hydrophobe/amphiphile efflux-1 family RND transporter [Acidobacteria bacterium]|nr:MAG: hydrophobe/amphiphile efflux-1 family RND transporter [Acidobacteriota bacterium]
MFVDFFIKRPIFATVCALLIILGGAVSIPTLPIAQFPNLAPPTVQVGAFYNGASAQTVETSVTTPLEQAINGVEGMKYMTSTSGNDGSSGISVVFDLNRDVDLAAVDVQNRVNQALGRMPNEVKTTGVSVVKATNNFVFGAGFYAENNRYDSLFISNYLDIYVRDALKRIKGVGQVFIFGERKYAMRVWLDPVRMASRQLTASDVVSALAEQNVQVAAGAVGQAPAPPNQAFEISVRAVGRLTEPSEFENIILKTANDGTIVRLKDVGHAELGAESYGSGLRFNGYPAVGVGVTYNVAFDTTNVVADSIKDVVTTLLEAIALVIIVIFVFLQDWRSTVIPSVTIPVSLVGTFIFVKALGFSINTLTLFGITLATGLVVDDAIVVIENVQRHISEGITEAHNAASVAMSEVAGAVVATSLVLVSVFVPVAFFPGTTGIMFRQFALTIAFSVSISAFNALTLTPALSALMLGRHTGESDRGIFGLFNRGVHKTTNAYRDTLKHLIPLRWAVVLVFLAGLAFTYWYYQRVPRGFVPQEDQGWFMVLIQCPPGASIEYTENIAKQVEVEMMKQKEIIGSFAVSGFSFGGSASNRGMVFGTFAPLAERRGSQHAADAVIARLRGPLFGISGAIVVPFAPPSVNGLGNFGGFQYILQDEGGHTPEQLGQVAYKVVGAGRDPKSGLAGLFTSYSATDPQFLVSIDREKAKSLGVSLSQITNTLQVYMASVYVNDFDFNNRAYRVYAQADTKWRMSPDNMRQFYVRSDRGGMIPLADIVKIEQTITPPVISHYNLFRSVEIDGSAAQGQSSGQAIQKMEELSKKLLPQGYSFAWTGLSLEEIESGSQVVMLFALGLLVVYLTLAAQYESWSLPFIVILAVPMAILGAVLAQSLRGLINDIYCQVGLVMLIGLSGKNAILIVEFAEQLRQRGLSITEAAIEAARIRLRPILMTSFAFILGVLPLVLATGAGKNGRQSVGTTVFGGMLAATTLNLLFIPILYVTLRTLQERGRERKPQLVGSEEERVAV